MEQNNLIPYPAGKYPEQAKLISSAIFGEIPPTTSSEFATLRFVCQAFRNIKLPVLDIHDLTDIRNTLVSWSNGRVEIAEERVRLSERERCAKIIEQCVRDGLNDPTTVVGLIMETDEV